MGWDYEDVWDGPWTVDLEPREDGRIAVKSGCFTVFTAGDYFDGGGPLEARLRWICDRVNDWVAAEHRRNRNPPDGRLAGRAVNRRPPGAFGTSVKRATAD